MEEASVAGESPDRSKQRESSAEQTSGSAGPVPERQDPRLAVARETGGSESRKTDTATHVLSVREASASAPEETPASDDADADADVDAESRDDGAEDGAEGGEGRLREAVAAWVRTAEPKDEEKSSRGEDASGADGDVKPAVGDENEGESPREADTGADADVGEDDGPSGDAAEDAVPSADTASDEDQGDAPKGETPSGKDADDEAGEAKAADGEAAALKGDEAADSNAAKADDGKGDGKTGDDKGSDKAADGKAATPQDDGEADDSDAAAAKDHGEASDGKAAAAKAADGKGDGKTGDDKGSDKAADGKAATAQDDETADDSDAAAAKDHGEADDGKGTGEADDETADAEGGEDRGADAPVDQPTAVFRTPRPAEPGVDQPTTMLKLGDAAARERGGAAEAERTSKFVALKDDPAIRKTPRQGGPAAAESTTFLPQVGPERTTQQPLPPKPPLDLLAELTNTPPPPQTPLRTAVRRIKIWTPLVLLLVIVFAVVQNVRPLPTPTLVLTAQDSYTFEGGKPQIPWPDSGQAALDVDGIGTFGSSGEQKPVPIASVAKVMTAYVILRDHPLKSGAEGPKIPVDALAEQQSDAGQESTVNVTEGDAISEREAIEAILIASANNVARLLARWDAGSEEAFVEKMNKAAEDLGMSDTTYTDPSGLNDTTVSTAVDQVKLARAAMEQPVFREVAAMMEYVDYKGEKHGNWNRLVGRDDVVGIKTGTTTSALGNLSFAAKKDVDGEVYRIVGAVLRQPEGGEDNTILSGALDAGHQLILAGQDALRAETILKKGAVVGYADDGLGGKTPVVVTEDVKAVGWAGLEVKLTFAGTELPHTAKAGTEVGTLTVGDGKNGAVKVPVALKDDLVEPGFTDKLTRVA
ncbi:D-alanyl-D-alanine carboxypeptidase [Streptomyces viridodiastaticus]|uniref:D-alanyl-D-alanine carboxypeptidase n=1 Tax=Streptomyces albogriseolus TaxID=1887 RepID=UPI0022509DBC|nr:D-alanyl-D-alanine carboxypeptidase [Streptomyces viridodiastaticus]MCX4567467.1 D-alanyl-D-alanine carboxypeptidase [Streptomyces viridodiastaticus]